MPTYKLTYFDIRGRGELIRMLFVLSGKEYEDKRVQFADWPKLKPTLPGGSLPILEIDGKVYTQSLAIAQYLAKEFKLSGKTSLECLRVDEVVHTAEDMLQAMAKSMFEKDETKKKEMIEKLAKEDVPRFTKIFESFLTENKTGFFVGNSISAADLAVYNVLESAITKLGEAALKDSPKLLENRKKVAADSKICNYLKKRKQTDM
ncbi:glutathione S-transferase-like [Gigantopelta aegis]|uniref:glutathione S-transferase-like n=1 Tax=Gigantopelta aegis TaxID=1735272 RepID=UPI001B88790F|nr:glutathione S-transferase-like [Gigantopelta aegis]